MKYDIIIIGFGPTGATLANLLGLNGISTLLIDREYSSCELPRAVHFDGEVMRVFQTIGISDHLVKLLRVNAGMRFVNKSTGEMLLDWPRPQEIGIHGWHASYRFHQPDLESLLHENLKKFPSVEIRNGCEVREIKNLEGSVEVLYEDLKKAEHSLVYGKYLIGCEGARSLTRRLICNPIEETIEDFDFNQSWLVVDIILNSLKPELSDYTMQYCDPESPITCASGPGLRRRWEFAISNDEEQENIIDDASIYERLRPWVTQSEACIERYAVYQFHAILALKWRKKRMFIAGDAAHQTPPFMGQGMCAGIRDAANLAWKLTLSLASEDKEYILDSYEKERVDHVRDYITTAIKLGELVNSTNQKDIFEKLNSPDGKMKSILPKLGKGLAVQGNNHIGTMFPQLQLDIDETKRTLIDDFCGYAPALIMTSEFMKSLSAKQLGILKDFRKQGLHVLADKPKSGIEKYLNRLQLKAVLIRPDRYILATSSNSAEFELLLQQVVNVISSKTSLTKPVG